MTLSPATLDPASALKRSSVLAERLQSSDCYRECERVVGNLTGLKLRLESSDGGDLSPFFGVSTMQNVLEQHGDWLARARQAARQHRIPASQVDDDHEVSIAGLREAAVVLRIGTERIGVLRLGQALTSPPTVELVASVCETWFGAQRVPDPVRLAVMQMPVVTGERWSSAVWLLQRVAAYLGAEGLRVVALNGGVEPEPVARAREFISRHFLDEDLSLPRIAQAVGVSPNYLSHVYRKHTSLSVTESINRLRIEHALDMLNEGGRRVSEVARACGFGSLSQFNRSFRRYVGSSPTSFKSQGLPA